MPCKIIQCIEVTVFFEDKFSDETRYDVVLSSIQAKICYRDDFQKKEDQINGGADIIQCGSQRAALGMKLTRQVLPPSPGASHGQIA